MFDDCKHFIEIPPFDFLYGVFLLYEPRVGIGEMFYEAFRIFEFEGISGQSFDFSPPFDRVHVMGILCPDPLLVKAVCVQELFVLRCAFEC